MKNIATNPKSAALISFILCLPLTLSYTIIVYEIEPLVSYLNYLLTDDTQQINNLGRSVVFGGLLLLPVAFVLNLLPTLSRPGPERKRRIYAVNLILGTAILLFITLTWGGLIMEEIYCLRGIRCD